VTDSQGNPIPGVTVRVGENDAAGFYTTTTDAAGHYSITLYPGLYTGSYGLDAFGPDIVEFNMSLGRIPLGVTVTQDLRLTRKGSLAGFIGDASKTPITPVAGAIVTVGRLWAGSDATGRYTLTGLTPGANDVRVSATGFDTAEVSVTVVSGVVTTQNFLLVEASAVMTGTVSDSETGDTLDGATASVGSSSTETAIDGTYTISGIPAGQQQVTVSAVHHLTLKRLVQFRDHQTLTMDFVLITQRPPGPRPS
jgi:large repetitive protein